MGIVACLFYWLEVCNGSSLNRFPHYQKGGRGGGGDGRGNFLYDRIIFSQIFCYVVISVYSAFSGNSKVFFSSLVSLKLFSSEVYCWVVLGVFGILFNYMTSINQDFPFCFQLKFV